MTPFRCPRSCRWAERHDLCRFAPVWEAVQGQGVSVVNSHTTEIKMRFADLDALAAVVARLGGRVIGQGCHQLYSTKEEGFAVQLPGWRFPIVIQDGVIRYDNHQGYWGSLAELIKLRREYAIEVATRAAQAQGWMVERNDSSLTIYHPSGGWLVLQEGELEAFGFVGGGCHDAAAPIIAALGEGGNVTLKPEGCLTPQAARVAQGGGG